VKFIQPEKGRQTEYAIAWMNFEDIMLHNNKPVTSWVLVAHTYNPSYSGGSLFKASPDK
jgi:hypothetical protein